MKIKFKEIKLTEEETVDLVTKAKDGDIAARNTVIEAHMALMVKLANRMTLNGTKCSSNIEDYIQAGVFGIISAIENFDASKGKFRATRFLSHAYIHVYKKIHGEHMKLVDVVPFTHDTHLLYNRISKYTPEMFVLLGREPSDGELTDYLIERHKEYKARNLTVDEVSFVKDIFNPTLSLSNPVDNVENNDACSYSDELEAKAIAYGDTPVVGETMSTQETDIFWDNVKIVINQLSDTEQKIITKLYGIGCEEHTPKKVAKELGISEREVKNIERNTLNKIKTMDVMVSYHDEYLVR